MDPAEQIPTAAAETWKFTGRRRRGIINTRRETEPGFQTDAIKCGLRGGRGGGRRERKKEVKEGETEREGG